MVSLSFRFHFSAHSRRADSRKSILTPGPNFGVHFKLRVRRIGEFVSLSYSFSPIRCLFVICFRSFSDHLPPASLLRLNLPNTMMLAQPCRFGIMVRDGTPALPIFPGCC